MPTRSSVPCHRVCKTVVVHLVVDPKASLVVEVTTVIVVPVVEVLEDHAAEDAILMTMRSSTPLLLG